MVTLAFILCLFVEFVTLGSTKPIRKTTVLYPVPGRTANRAKPTHGASKPYHHQ